MRTMVQKEDYSNYFQNPRTKLIKWRKKFSYMYIIPRTIYISMRRWWCSSCSRPIRIRSNGFCTVLTLCHQSVVTHGIPHSCFRANQTFLLLIVSQKIPISVFDLTRRGLEPTIYTVGGDHINHSTTDVVWDLFNRL